MEHYTGSTRNERASSASTNEANGPFGQSLTSPGLGIAPFQPRHMEPLSNIDFLIACPLFFFHTLT